MYGKGCARPSPAGFSVIPGCRPEWAGVNTSKDAVWRFFHRMIHYRLGMISPVHVENGRLSSPHCMDPRYLPSAAAPALSGTTRHFSGNKCLSTTEASIQAPGQVFHFAMNELRSPPAIIFCCHMPSSAGIRFSAGSLQGFDVDHARPPQGLHDPFAAARRRALAATMVVRSSAGRISKGPTFTPGCSDINWIA